MGFREAKVYFDGSHYIAIPHTESKTRYRPKPKEETITVAEKEVESAETDTVSAAFSRTVDNGDIWTVKDSKEAENACMTTVMPSKTARTTTKKALFDELYKTYIGLKRRESKRVILTEMRPYFDTDEQARDYITAGFERKQRNLICRRIRMIRKANLAGFNFFVTFTYNEKLHTEDTFKKQLQNCFRNFCYRKGWKYMGVWERSPGKQRLHFHGLFAIPERKQYQNNEEKNEFFNSFIYRVVLFDDCVYIFYNTSPQTPTKFKLDKDDLTELREYRENRKNTRFQPLGFKSGAFGGVWHLKLELFASSILALSWAFFIAVSISLKAIGVSSIRL